MKKPILAVTSGALAALSFPTPGLWPLSFVAWVPLLIALRDVAPREGARLGMIAGATFFAIVLRWVAPLSSIGFVVLVAYVASFVALFGAAAALLRGKLRVAVPAAWVALEWTRGWVFTGFGWAGLGYALPPSMSGLAAFGGVPLLSLVIIATNVAIAEALSGQRRAFAVAALPLVLLIGRSPRYDGTLRVAAINAAIEPRTVRADVHGSLNAYAALSDGAASSQPALLIWPETALPAPLDVPGATPIRAMSLSRRVREVWRAPLLLGVPTRATERTFYNAGAFVDGERATIVYRKRRLVPLGELDVAGFSRVLPGPTLVPGEGSIGAVEVSGAHVGVLICFEDLFADDALSRARSADVLVVLTNDAWLGSTGAAQHLAVTAMRAIETGRTIVRAANRGATTILDARGVPVVPPQLGAAAVVGDAPRSNDTTVYARAPDLVPFAACAVALFSIALRLSRREIA